MDSCRNTKNFKNPCIVITQNNTSNTIHISIQNWNIFETKLKKLKFKLDIKSQQYITIYPITKKNIQLIKKIVDQYKCKIYFKFNIN